MRNVAEQIADGLVLEMRDEQSDQLNSYVNMVDLLLQQLAEKVVSLLKQANSTADDSDEQWEARLQKAEAKLSLPRSGSQPGSGRQPRSGSQDVAKEQISSLPNLKYARPKYENLESVMKFVEQEDGRDGVKLVIMNFND
jgi:hypothetical protein